jgi:hypothetical protein
MMLSFSDYDSLTGTQSGLAPSRRGFVAVGCAFLAGLATTSLPQALFLFDGTSATTPSPVGALSSNVESAVLEGSAQSSAGHLINEARRISGLTWLEIAKVMQVSRRVIHFWANGRPINSVNQERLSRVIATLRVIDRGTGRETRDALMNPAPDNRLPFDLLVDGKFEEVSAILGRGERRQGAMMPLSREARKARRPAVSPIETMEALQDKVSFAPAPLIRGKVLKRPVVSG